MSKNKKIKKANQTSEEREVSNSGISFGFKKLIYFILKQIINFTYWLTSNIKHTVVFMTTLALVLVSTFMYTHNVSSIEKMSVSYLDTVEKAQIRDNLVTEFDGSYEIKDYLIYGESFKILKDTYKQAPDDTMGKNVVMRNVATGKEYSYTFDDGADSGVKLGQLEEGLYEVYIFDHFSKKRVYMEKEFHSVPFTTLRRKGMVNTISIDCQKDYVHKFDVDFDLNYMFLTVTAKTPLTNVIDVMIDPCGLNVNIKTKQDVGYFVNDKIDESVASYELAKLIQAELEQYGLKSSLTRKKTEKIGYYGTESRIGRAFESGAKVFLSLGFGAGAEVNRPNIVTSAYSTGINANYISYASRELGVELKALSKRPEFEPGVSYDMFTTDENFEYTHWEFYPQLRESGGKATFTGTYEYSTPNKLYADAHGMCGFMYFFASEENEESIDYFIKNKELIAKSIALGIAEAYDIEGTSGQ